MLTTTPGVTPKIRRPIAYAQCINTPRHAPVKCKSTQASLGASTFAFGAISAPVVTTKDRRKKNVSLEEKAIIIEGLSKYGACLHGALSGTTSKVQKDEILLEITTQVNALGVEAGTPRDITKKINDLRRLVKEKLAKIRRHASGTGGGPATNITLTPDELVIARCLEREQVEGLEGYDSVDQPLRTSKCVLSSLWCVSCVGGQGNM